MLVRQRKWETRRVSSGRILAIVVAGTLLCACQPPDLAHHPITVQAPPGNGSSAGNDLKIEIGIPLGLTPLQQEAVVTGVRHWLKDGASAQFGELRAARNSRGHITVCGTVDGRNTAGRMVGLSPFVGVLQGTSAAPTFVLVEIGTLATDRAIVQSLCHESGIYGIG
jgi:hypothetical protein